MNTFLAVVWGLINPDMFAAVADTLEDVMQASVPAVIENVRVAEIDQGNNPIRILSLRALPDSRVKDLKQSIHNENKKTKDPQEAAADEEGGDYYNLEVSFAYHAKPTGTTASDKARNMHMQLVFYLGMRGLFGVPLPIFVELQELVGTVRLRLMLTPEPPFANGQAWCQHLESAFDLQLRQLRSCSGRQSVRCTKVDVIGPQGNFAR
jgi:Ca2+-dependent lipid-binding protein